MVATRVVGSPVFESDAFERLIKGDLETGLDEVYYGLTGPAFGYKNKELDEIASKTGVKRLLYLAALVTEPPRLMLSLKLVLTI